MRGALSLLDIMIFLHSIFFAFFFSLQLETDFVVQVTFVFQSKFTNALCTKCTFLFFWFVITWMLCFQVWPLLVVCPSWVVAISPAAQPRPWPYSLLSSPPSTSLVSAPNTRLLLQLPNTITITCQQQSKRQNFTKTSV